MTAKRAGIVLDTWKLPIFRRRLTAAGFVYEEKGEFTSDTRVLYVVIENVELLRVTLEAATAEAEEAKRTGVFPQA